MWLNIEWMAIDDEFDAVTCLYYQRPHEFCFIAWIRKRKLLE